ncbi:MAB_1171c family putative transporter [Streptomyces sp. NPDC046261]|uniref:MAB_1171c family putative transporter n=1 Tax=Streptomyces sp. NPDC046261 TaxID=3157200 RepID=UPI0033D29B5A
MPAWLETTGIAALWVVAIARAPQGLRDRSQRPLWLAIGMIALAMSLHLEPVTAALAHLVPDEHWIDLTKHLFSILDAAAVLWFIFGAADRRRHTALLFCTAATVMAALVLLDLGAPGHDRNQIAGSAATPGVPLAYWWLFFVFHLVADTTCGVVCWRYGRQDTPRLLRLGLRLFGTGTLLASLLWVLKLVYLHTRSAAVCPWFSPVAGVEAWFMAIGAVPPVVIQLRTHRRYRRTYRRLAPLWRDLTAASPDVVLEPGNRLWAAAMPLQLRLYRRVIEIRDAMIVLRDYVTPDALDAVHRHVAEQAVPEHLVNAHVTACWLTAALEARCDGRPPRSQTVNLAGPAANDLSDEIGHLLRVADAYGSPSLRAYKAALSGTAA